MNKSVPLKRLALVRYGLGQPPPLADDGIPILRATNIFRGRIVEDGLIRARISDLPLDRAPLLRSGEVLVVRSGAHTGDSALITPDWEGAAPGYDLRVTPGPQVESRFLAYSLLGRTALDQMALARSRAAQPHLNAEDLGEVTLLNVGLDRQSAIADYLDAETTRVDAIIAKKEQLVDRLFEMRGATTTAGVAGRLGVADLKSSASPWLESCPAHWRTAKLTLVARLGSGHTPSRSHPEWWVNCTVPWITTGEVAEMRSDRSEYVTDTREKVSALGLAHSAATVHPAGTVVLCRTASAGYSAIMATDMATSQDFATWTCGPLLRPRYLLLCLRAMRGDLLGRLAMGSTHKTIYMPDIESVRIPLPPLDEQDQIVEQVWARLRRIDRIVDSTQRQIELLREYRAALITAAVTGQLDVQGAAV